MADVEVWDEKGKRTLTEKEYLAEFPEGTLLKPVPDDPMTEGERYLYDKMQAEGEASAALFAAGLTLDDLEAREYDWEGALQDLREREVRAADDAG